MCFLLILHSCKKDEEEACYLQLSLGKEYHSLIPQQDILGKWESIAAGEYENELISCNSFYLEFTSDIGFIYRYESYKTNSWDGTCSIYEDSIVLSGRRDLNLKKFCYYYTFYKDGNILKLVDLNPSFMEKFTYIDESGKESEVPQSFFIPNIKIYKRKK